MARAVATKPVPPTRARNLVKSMTRAFLQYPRRVDATTEALEKIARAFTPAYQVGVLPPVSGVGQRGDHEVVVLFSNPSYQLNFNGLPELFGQIDVEVLGEFYGDFVPSAQGGDSFGYGAPGGKTATLGCVVADAGGQQYFMSCNHVIANTNLGVNGSDIVWSPGSRDGGTNANTVGVLYDFETIYFGGVRPNYMDAAVAKPNASASPRSIHGIGTVSGVDPSPAYNLPVKKYGKATALTTGQLTLRNLAMVLPYGGNSALFVDQYGILEVGGGVFARDGDSGSLVVSGDAVGLIFATSTNGNLAVANPIEPILTRFAVSF